ncbi:MAG: PAS domain-containing protein [Nitrospirae bacterium]|nr:PAS domain-containing protein [Nitrospirota bacterium]
MKPDDAKLPHGADDAPRPAPQATPHAAPRDAPAPAPDDVPRYGAFRGRLRNRLLVPYFLLITIAFSAAAVVYLKTSQDALDDSMSTRLTALAGVVAGEMKPEYLKRLGPGDETTRLYRLLMTKLERYRAGAGIADIFVIDPDGRVLLDVDEEIPIGREYLFLKLDTVELQRVWQGDSVASTLYAGDDGRLYKSGYAPILDASGTVIAAVGVEAGADFLAAVNTQRRNVLVLIAVAMLMTGLISVGVARSIVMPIKRLVSAIGQVKGGGRYPTVEVTTHDEVGYLTQAFNSMTRRLQDKDAELKRLYELERDRAERIEDLSGLVFEGIPNGVVAVDLLGRILLCNQAAARIVRIAGYPFPETGIPPSAITALGADNPVQRYLGTVLKEGRSFLREDARFMGDDGTERMLGISAFPLSDREEHPVGAIAIFSDLTEVTRLQDQLRINERLAALGELSAGVAHEIRNPLAAIRGFVELLGRRVPDERGQTLVTSILEEVNGLNHIVTDFLTFAREPVLETETVQPGELLQAALALAIPEDDGPVRVDLTVADGLPALEMDRIQVKQALVNIMQNGVHAMEPDGGTLFVEAMEDKGGVAFRVTDTGPGVPDEVRDKVFNPFFTTRAEGTGLGLSIASKVVAGHGGRIELENTREHGARFTLWFPTHPPRSPQPAAARKARDTP